ncbi:hypothetical protein BRD56_09000 [Thermoplasmatales archaeon SW_10_69_26]|jgi:hypothetical protein|nr:MAG: hypothetical protein BRD56_09000 [Thermoplasmatales archaeon SW_10_69_26]
MRVRLVAVMVLASALTGCLDGSVVDQLRNDLEAQDEFEDRTLLLERVPFTPAGVADPNRTVEDESDVASQWNQSFRVPPDTRQVTVTFSIEFSNPDPGGVVPEDSPEGEVRTYVVTADGEERNLTRSQPAEAGFDFPTPTAGEWQVGMDARGNGTVTFDVHGLVPIASSGS